MVRLLWELNPLRLEDNLKQYLVYTILLGIMHFNITSNIITSFHTALWLYDPNVTYEKTEIF